MSILLALIANAYAGRLAFAQTTVPVAGAFVTASGNNGFGSSTTNSQGLYNITTLLDTGNYSVTASATGYIDTSVQNVRVTAGAETANVTIQMPVSGGISGRVTDVVSGSPVQSALVSAVNVSGSGPGSSTFTDSNGNYQIITNLGTGVYNVTASFAAGYLTRTISNISVTIGVSTNNVNLPLSRSATISGTVTDSIDASVLQGIIVYAVTSTGSFAAVATTNSTGKYTLNTNLGTGTYNVSVLLPANHMPKTIGGVAVVAGNQYTVDIPLDRSGIISGRITSSTGTGLANAIVTATATAGGFTGFATTNSTGFYRITDGLGTASYTVFAIFGTGFNTTGVGVTQGSETSNVNLQITVTPSGTISGRVTNSTGSPLTSASVSATGLSGSGSATTDSNGNYVISTGLGTGTYNVTASQSGFVTQTQTGVSVIVSQVTSNVNIQLQALVSGRISGRVQTTGTVIPELHGESLMVLFFAGASIAIIVKKLRNPQLKQSRPL